MARSAIRCLDLVPARSRLPYVLLSLGRRPIWLGLGFVGACGYRNGISAGLTGQLKGSAGNGKG